MVFNDGLTKLNAIYDVNIEALPFLKETDQSITLIQSLTKQQTLAEWKNDKNEEEKGESLVCDEEITVQTSATGTQTDWTCHEQLDSTTLSEQPTEPTSPMSPLVLPPPVITEQKQEYYFVDNNDSIFFDPCRMCGETGLCSCLWRPDESQYPPFTQEQIDLTDEEMSFLKDDDEPNPSYPPQSPHPTN